MKLQNFTNETLSYLYQGYLQNPTALWDISPIVDKCGYSKDQVFRELKETGWVRNLMNNGMSLMAQITIEGINAIDPDYLTNHVHQAIQYLGMNGGRGSLMEAFNITEGKDFHRVHDLAKYFEYIEYFDDPLYLFNDVQIGLSLIGRDYYEKNKPVFFS